MMFLEIVIALIGAAVGSFLNVCVRRIPLDESIIAPPSHCPNCNYAIRFYDNIPLVSYLLLRGKCRNCGERISIRYPLVELATALLALVLFWKFGMTFRFLICFIFSCVLLTITLIDFDHQIIPDILTLPGIPLCFLAAVVVLGVPWVDAGLGLLIGGGILYAIAFGYELITKREGMGGGDIKLLAMLGAFFGWKSLLFIVLVSSFAGALVGITAMVIKGKDMKYAVPFGPFLSLAALAYMFWGDAFLWLIFMRH